MASFKAWRDSTVRRVAPRRWSSLVAKLLALNVGLSALAVAATGAVTYELAREALRHEIVASGEKAVESFARANALEWLDERAGRLNLRLRLTGLVESDPRHLLAAHALDRDRRVMASGGNAAGDGDLDGFTMATVGEGAVRTSAGTLVVTSPVVYDGVTLGYTSFVYSDVMLADAGAKMLSSAGALVAALALLDAVVLALVLRRVLRPVVELGHAARELARGNYGYRLHSRLGEDEIGTAARSFNAMCDALEVHMRFSNAALVNRIRAGGDVDQVREPRLSVVFGDAEGYTRWSQRQRPTAIFRTLNRYFTAFGRVTVGRFGGVIDKFMGDGVMAYFGLEHRDEPGQSEQSVRDALRASIYAQMALRLLSECQLRFEGTEPLRYRFGIASGRCLVGPIGARGILLDYSLIGHVVNLAARLEGKAPPGGLAIDGFTLRDAGEDFVEVAELGEQRVKGLDTPVEIFVVRGFKQSDEIELLRRFLLVDLLRDPVLCTSILGEAVDASRVEVVQSMLDRQVSEPLYLPI